MGLTDVQWTVDTGVSVCRCRVSKNNRTPPTPILEKVREDVQPQLCISVVYHDSGSEALRVRINRHDSRFVNWEFLFDVAGEGWYTFPLKKVPVPCESRRNVNQDLEWWDPLER